MLLTVEYVCIRSWSVWFVCPPIWCMWFGLEMFFLVLLQVFLWRLVVVGAAPSTQGLGPRSAPAGGSFRRGPWAVSVSFGKF